MSQEASVALTEADPEQTTTIHSLYLFTSHKSKPLTLTSSQGLAAQLEVCVS